MFKSTVRQSSNLHMVLFTFVYKLVSVYKSLVLNSYNTTPSLT